MGLGGCGGAPRGSPECIYNGGPGLPENIGVSESLWIRFSALSRDVVVGTVKTGEERRTEVISRRATILPWRPRSVGPRESICVHAFARCTQ